MSEKDKEKGTEKEKKEKEETAGERRGKRKAREITIPIQAFVGDNSIEGVKHSPVEHIVCSILYTPRLSFLFLYNRPPTFRTWLPPSTAHRESMKSCLAFKRRSKFDQVAHPPRKLSLGERETNIQSNRHKQTDTTRNRDRERHKSSYYKKRVTERVNALHKVLH